MAILPKMNPASPLTKAFKLGLASFAFAGVFSLVSNLLYLALPIYTMQIYDRVLSGQSQATLLVLSFGCLGAFAVSGLIDHFRARVLINFGIIFDERTAGPVFSTLFDAVVRRDVTARAQSLRDLDNLRQVITGQAISVLFDLPWIPIFLGVLFLIDPLVSVVTFAGGLVLLVLAILQDRGSRPALKEANDAALQSYAFTEAALRNGEVVRALGMLPSIGDQWARYRTTTMERSARASERASVYGNAIRVVSMGMQVVIVGLGAWLVITGKIGPGVLFANMILGARALQPIQRVVGSWSSLVSGQQAYDRLARLLDQYEAPGPVTLLPRPSGLLSVENVSFAPRGAASLVLNGVSFQVGAGETLGIVGPSGAGKSTLTRLLVGVWKPGGGVVRLDGADVYQWERASFGGYAGYLPQDIELFSGTVRANIARFRADAPDEAVVKAAQLAGAHEMILRLPQGYDTQLGEQASVLSVGQRQRVGLARALFGEPAYVVLDEPNAALDSEGEASLLRALEILKQAGSTVVIVSHKPNVFRTADKMLVLKNGRVELFGPREQVMAKIMQAAAAPAIPQAEAAR
jgi:PrtD family type I secretion system ABC transporter